MKKKKIIIIVILSLLIALIFMIPNISNAKDPIYREPTMEGTAKDGLDDMINDAENFEKQEGASIGKDNSTTFELEQGKLQSFSSSLFSVMIIAATAVTIIIGIIIGIKYMMGSVEQKAEYKKMLLPYVIGCAAIYGALAIWKIFVTILGSI